MGAGAKSLTVADRALLLVVALRAEAEDRRHHGDEGESGVFPIAEKRRGMPMYRGECEGGERPCPWARCRHHLAADVIPPGRPDGHPTLRENFPGKDFATLRETCALDVANRGGITLEEVGRLTGITRERVRQIEVRVLRKLKASGALRAIIPEYDTIASPPEDEDLLEDEEQHDGKQQEREARDESGVEIVDPADEGTDGEELVAAGMGAKLPPSRRAGGG